MDSVTITGSTYTAATAAAASESNEGGGSNAGGRKALAVADEDDTGRDSISRPQLGGCATDDAVSWRSEANVEWVAASFDERSHFDIFECYDVSDSTTRCDFE